MYTSNAELEVLFASPDPTPLVHVLYKMADGVYQRHGLRHVDRDDFKQECVLEALKLRGVIDFGRNPFNFLTRTFVLKMKTLGFRPKRRVICEADLGVSLSEC